MKIQEDLIKLSEDNQESAIQLKKQFCKKLGLPEKVFD